VCAHAFLILFAIKKLSIMQTVLQLKLYNTVIEDVISGVRESFIDEGVDEQVLQELKQIWEAKLMASKAVELNPDPPEPQVPQINTHKAVSVNKGMQRSNVLLTNDLLQYNLYEVVHCYWIFCIEHSVMVMHFIYI